MSNLTWSAVPNTVSSGASKVSRINSQRGALDSAISEQYTLAVDTSEAITTSILGEYMVFKFPASNTVEQTLTIPSSNPRLFAVINASDVEMSVVKGTTSITIKANYGELLYSGAEANNLHKITPSVTQATRYTTVNIYANGTYSANEIVAATAVSANGVLVAGLTGSIFEVESAPTGAISFDLQKNGVSIGSIDFAAAATSATFTFINETPLMPGDIISIVAPATPDGTLAGLYGVLELKEQLGSVPGFPSEDPNQILRLHFIDETLDDSSPDNRTVTLVAGTETYADGALVMDGSTFLSTPHSTDFAFWTDDCTIEAWVKASSWANWSYLFSGTNYPVLFGKGSATSNVNYYSFGPDANGALVIFGYTAAHVKTADGALPTDQWVHIAMTHTGGQVYLFIDGDLKVSLPFGTAADSASYPIYIGKLNNANIAGEIDDFTFTRGVAKYVANFTPPARTDYSVLP